MDINNDKGFALPTTVLLVTVLTVMLAAAFTRTSSEHQIANGTQFQDEALSIAESGLQRYMESTSSRPSDGDSIRINTTGGYAWVFARTLRNPADTLENETFVITSTGYVIEASQGSTPMAQRTVGQMAVWQSPVVTKKAAFIAANGVVFGNRETVQIWGDYSAQDTFSLRISSMPGLNSEISLSQYDNRDSVQTGGTDSTVARETGIDWARIRAGDFDYDKTSKPSSYDLNWDTFFVDGDLDLDRTAWGSGLLIVTGDLSFKRRGGQYWLGVILVGGRIKIKSRSDPRIYGMIATGLNEMLGTNVPQTTDMGRRRRPFRVYLDPGYINNALADLRGLVPLGNTWVDNWSTY